LKKIDSTAEHSITEQRSKFHALVFPASNLDDVKSMVRKQTRKYHKARHHCWACRVEGDSGELLEQARDDGEVGRPGLGMLALLRRCDMQGGIVVSRFFGGIKLGPGGVSRAFREAAKGAIEKIMERH